jgi:hypothetical protein
MTPEDESTPTSLVCFLPQADAAHAGYLSRAEIALELRRLMARIKEDGLHARLKVIVEELEKACPKD